MTPPQSREQIRKMYDRLAREYALNLFNELESKPLDRELLDEFVQKVQGHGTVCDVGCGPGHVASYLREAGLTEVRGLDLSAEMVDTARSLNPEIPFEQGDLTALNVSDGAWAGATAFYAVVNLAKYELPPVFAELHRVLKPGGWLLLSFHCGKQVVHVEEMWGVEISLDFRFFETSEIVGLMRKAGFSVKRVVERAPYPDVEYPSRRTYLLGVRG